MNARLFLVGLTALRVLRWANGGLSRVLRVDADAQIIVDAGPWCVNRARVFLIEHGEVQQRQVIATRMFRDVAVIETVFPDLILILRRDAEVNGIEAQRMAEAGDE